MARRTDWLLVAAMLATWAPAPPLSAQATSPAVPPGAGVGAAKHEDSPVMRIPPIGPSAAMWKVEPGAARPEIQPRRFVSHHKGSFAGRRIAYSVVAEDSILRDTLGAPTGSIFAFSYLADKVSMVEQRPVLFIFNGGPGSSSLWLHMGILGPRKVDFRDVTPSQVPPFRVVDNPDSLLAVTDLVFIDPIGTGFSRYWGKGAASDFYGREQDAAAMVRFINAWLREHGRWNSPKYLLGESYGTTRANLVARRLMGGFLDGTLKGVSLNGVILVGGDGGLSKPIGNDRFAISFTTMAATAWYHDRVDKTGRSFDRFIAEAERFALDELVPALDGWGGLDERAKAAVATRHAAFSGLTPAFLLSKDLRIAPSDYVTALLADRKEVIGFYDSRYSLPVAGSLGDPVADDAAMGQYSAPFIGAFNSYIRDELGVAIDDDYVVIDWINVNLPWNHGGKAEANATPFNQGEGDPGADLAAMMRRNPDLRLMSIQGWFDMFGAVGSARYGIKQRKLPQDRVTEKAYWSGHMAYVGDAGPKMAADLKDFILRSSAAAQR
ncbi:MAG: serine carboxypeptidase family protein [Alphaproteobacteria bacterium]|nr:serine carboxypeptidase family protein [Alphaproteobacteria bacterium]